MTQSKTILDLFRLYEKRLLALGKPAEVKNMQTALLRSTVPGWGGPIPKNLQRSTKQDVEAGLHFLGLLPIKALREGTAAQEKVFNQTAASAKQRTNARYYLKKLIALAEDEGWLREKASAEAPSLMQLQLVGGKKVPLIPKLTNREKKPTYIFGSQPEDIINPRLQSQIDEFRRWSIARGLVEVSFSTDIVFLKQFFGWFLRYESASQWQPLQDEERTDKLKEIMDGFCFETMIPFVPLPKRSSFGNRSEYLEAKEDAKDIRTEEAEEAVKLFKRFLDFYSENHNTRELLLKMAMSVTLNLYKDQIDESNLETIPPILLKLRTLCKSECKESKRSPRAVPIEKKFVEYEEILQVTKMLKKLADQQERTKFRSKKKVFSEPRSPQAIACAYSRFLIISFLSLLPPDRQQFIRELEIGTSFARGCFGRGDIFIPEAEMSDPSKAGWCLNLTRYKTHKTYGDCKITLPNYDFGDGTALYDYIDLWLNRYRSLLNPIGDWLFVKHKKGDKWGNSDVCAMVVKVFNRHTGKPVNPHMLRHLFNTHLEESHASKSVKTASRKFMKQSDRMGETNYNHAITDRAVAPALAYMQELILESF